MVAADGQNIEPVTVDEIRLAVAETYDVIVEPDGSQHAYTLFAQAMDRSGYARGTLAVRETCRPVPNPDPRPELTMDDMGHGDHAAHGQAAATPAQGHDAHAGHGDHGAMDHGSDGSGMQAHPPARPTTLWWTCRP